MYMPIEGPYENSWSAKFLNAVPPLLRGKAPC